MEERQPVLRVRPAVHLEDRGHPAPRAARPHAPALDAVAVGRPHPAFLGLDELELGDERVVEAGDAPGVELAALDLQHVGLAR
ncbi:MAG: hypothetical protein ACK559_06105, partial [bacterium]